MDTGQRKLHQESSSSKFHHGPAIFVLGKVFHERDKTSPPCIKTTACRFLPVAPQQLLAPSKFSHKHQLSHELGSFRLIAVKDLSNYCNDAEFKRKQQLKHFKNHLSPGVLKLLHLSQLKTKHVLQLQKYKTKRTTNSNNKMPCFKNQEFLIKYNFKYLIRLTHKKVKISRYQKGA